MADRITHLENLAQMSATLTRIMNEHLTMMAERHQQAQEWQLRAEEGQRVRDELLQQLLQAVEVVQTDIVRIDETHS